MNQIIVHTIGKMNLVFIDLFMRKIEDHDIDLLTIMSNVASDQEERTGINILIESIGQCVQIKENNIQTLTFKIV